MTIYLVVLISTLSQIGFGGSRVAVSLYALELGANQFTVGVIIALYSLCPMFFSILIGRLSDRVSPHLPMIWGSAMMMAALLLPLAVPGIATLCVLAFLNGLGHLVFSIPLEAAVGGVGGSQHRARNYALITMSWSIANFLGPLISGFMIDSVGHQRVFWVLAAFVALPIAMLWRWPGLLPSTAKHADGETAKNKNVMDLWRIPALRSTFIAGGIVGSAQDLFQFYMPVYGHAVGLSASAIGTVLGMVALAAFVVRASIPFLAKKLSEATILTLAT
ncbi:MAG TPA: MFS transporter, partial [Burkholderiales bacterium]|nr:MFS transporter [Burkholderiales bacterium]